MRNVEKCWCGSADLENFSGYYLKCGACNTLLRSQRMPEEFYKSGDEPSRFYGKGYWTEFLVDEYGYHDITQLSRECLSERCIYWLQSLLECRIPPAKTLELGCGHGGLVFLMRLAGFDATGAEMSGWLCDYARKTFNISMMCGRIEELDVARKSLDVVLLMDVLEHMTNPRRALERIADVLRDDGIMVLQTPCWSETEKSYEQMKSENNIFLRQLKEREHLFLFSKNSIGRLLKETGFTDLEFRQPMFAYDMFIIAGKQSLPRVKKQDVVAELLKTPERRLVLALLDLYEQKEEKERLLSVCEADRAARLKVIERQTQEFADRLSSCEADRAARLRVIERQAQEFSDSLSASEADRAARLEVIEKQGETIVTLEEKLRDRDKKLKIQSEAVRVQEEKLKQREEELRKMRVAQHDLIKALDDFRNSVSWKMTSPLRRIAQWANNIAGRAGKDRA